MCNDPKTNKRNFIGPFSKPMSSQKKIFSKTQLFWPSPAHFPPPSSTRRSWATNFIWNLFLLKKKKFQAFKIKPKHETWPRTSTPKNPKNEVFNAAPFWPLGAWSWLKKMCDVDLSRWNESIRVGCVARGIGWQQAEREGERGRKWRKGCESLLHGVASNNKKRATRWARAGGSARGKQTLQLADRFDLNFIYLIIQYI